MGCIEFQNYIEQYLFRHKLQHFRTNRVQFEVVARHLISQNFWDYFGTKFCHFSRLCKVCFTFFLLKFTFLKIIRILSRRSFRTISMILVMIWSVEIVIFRPGWCLLSPLHGPQRNVCYRDLQAFPYTFFKSW